MQYSAKHIRGKKVQNIYTLMYRYSPFVKRTESHVAEGTVYLLDASEWLEVNASCPWFNRVYFRLQKCLVLDFGADGLPWKLWNLGLISPTFVARGLVSDSVVDELLTLVVLRLMAAWGGGRGREVHRERKWKEAEKKLWFSPVSVQVHIYIYMHVCTCM